MIAVCRYRDRRGKWRGSNQGRADLAMNILMRFHIIIY
ncbi:hypothetical protein NT01EI_1852 [Edwardsiella ictaluri 93-146]|uniref:Uncharacterized protein n=1 Tax=Edwardsiella ictaluri (strain 93-146) TaxID=634503 RepID=C5BGV0_EDWI9|nr:hypothetical protein NT01EI_1852 [Edwardsiella ictaluri 93-146]